MECSDVSCCAMFVSAGSSFIDTMALSLLARSSSRFISSVASNRIGQQTTVFARTSLASAQPAQGATKSFQAFRAMSSSASTLDDTELSQLRDRIIQLFNEKPCMPIILRLAWHDAGTYDAKTKTGGPNGSIRFSELNHNANMGLEKAIGFMQPIKDQFPKVSYGDLYQFAGIVAVEFCGGPQIPFRQGRVDVSEDKAVEEGRLPDGHKKQQHLRDIFYRMGFNDQEIVALSGAHTIGKAHPDRSDWDGPWTSKMYEFDNAYFRNLLEPQKAVDEKGNPFLQLPTDTALVEDAEMKKWVETYANNCEAFFKDYAAAHKKLSELGMDD
eukprot:gb/GECG01000375.1/.p1 GENE.gb/GECG01000375.1/~~gb/GECG01000375.1/.p1  ORF type:complete len:327 (+),score=47.35 gb/GECG01000375.1/:1-981(+)